MKWRFSKYHGTGNDFILFDNREGNFPKDDSVLIEKLCHRRFGIGADGLILIEKDAHFDFFMRYFNADGKEGSLCGNGGRCAVMFAYKIGITRQKTIFNAVDGIHQAEIKGDEVKLGMSDVSFFGKTEYYYYMDTGSPHIVIFNENIDNIDVLTDGRELRFNKDISDKGVNVNFVEIAGENTLRVRTYERGVEDETWSCGTGAVAAALAFHLHKKSVQLPSTVLLLSKGGELIVRFDSEEGVFKNITLKGNANMVFEAYC